MMRRLIVLAMVCVASAATLGGQQAAAPTTPSVPRIRALVVSGGCCHDYGYQAKVLMEAVSKSLPVDWTIVNEGARNSTTTRFALYEKPDWIAGFDIVIHNECSADVTDAAFIRRVTSAHRASRTPAMVIHCAMHTFRAAATDDWREFLGVTTKRHTAAHRISVKVAAPSEPMLQGWKTDWVTPVDELYVIEKFWPGARALATAISPEDQQTYPLAWANDYNGARVFGTTLGHGNDTWNDPVYQDLLARGFAWAVNRAR
jgi:uncharacterized protein